MRKRVRKGDGQQARQGHPDDRRQGADDDLPPGRAARDRGAASIRTPATVVEAKLSNWESFLALFGFCVLASASYLAMEITPFSNQTRSQALRPRFQTWINAHTQQVIIGGAWSSVSGSSPTAST